MIILIGFLIFIYSIILHEIAHGLMAERLGDPTARLSGRLTLNPLPHIDPIMSVLLPLFMRLANFPIIFGAAKPVPIDPYNLRQPRKDMGLVGLAGPATNILIAIAFSLIARGFFVFFPNQTIIKILAEGTLVNLFLAVFNLIPIPPLDGGRVAVSLLPDKWSDALASLENIGMMLVIFLLLFPTPIFSLQNFTFKIAISIFSFIFPNFPLT